MNPKRHHYVPQFYLRNFKATEGKISSPQIWIQDKENEGKEPFLCSIQNTLVEKHLYSLQLENGHYDSGMEHYLSSLEGKFASFLKRLENNFATQKSYHWLETFPTKADRSLVCEFILWQSKRNAARLREYQNSFKEWFINDGIHPQTFSTAEGKAFLKNESVKLLAGIGEDPKYDIRKALLERSWTITILPRGHKSMNFITNDRAVLITNAKGPDGIGQRDTEITLPLNRFMALSLYGYSQNTRVRPLNSLNEVKRINSTIYLFADRFVVSPSKELLLSAKTEALLCEEHN